MGRSIPSGWLTTLQNGASESGCHAPVRQCLRSGTGYAVRVDGRNMVIGGTSAVAPLMAGLIALINQQKGKSVGFIHPIIYANPTVFRDITQGDNITVAGGKGYSAAKGWDACTGLGVADGIKLSAVLGSQTIA